MTLFSRRVLQRVLDENASFVPKKRNHDACALLNVPHENYVATEWEQVILNATSKVGKVEYEPEMGGRKPDILFKTADGSLEFVADITAPSDQGFHDLNPMEAFEEEFWRRLRKANWAEGGLDLHVDSQQGLNFKGASERIRLKLPTRSKWNQEIFNGRFWEFLRNVRARPLERHELHIVSHGTGVHFTYDPARRGHLGSSHAVFTLANSKTRNPVYHALKEKGDQLKSSRYQGMTGIFLCDGACRMITALPNCDSFSIDEIVRYFFRQYDSVWFITVFGIQDREGRPLLKSKLHLNPRKRNTNLSKLKEVMDGIYGAIPEPQWSAQSARYRVKAKDLTGRYHGVLLNLA